MSTLPNITITYLAGAQDFLQEEGHIVVKLCHDGIDVTVNEQHDVVGTSGSILPHYTSWSRAWYRIWLPAIALICCIATGFVWQRSQSDEDTSRSYQPAEFESQTQLFPLASHVAGLLENLTKLSREASFIGLSPSQKGRLISGTTPSREEDGESPLWRGSLFAALSSVDELCDNVLNYDVLNRHWPNPPSEPESISRALLYNSCQASRDALSVADEFWQTTADLSKLLVSHARRQIMLLLSWTANHGAPDCIISDNMAPDNSSHCLSQAAYNHHPLWQLQAANITLQTVCSLHPDNGILEAVDMLAAAGESAAAHLATVRIATSAWLYGVASHKSFLQFTSPPWLSWHRRGTSTPEIQKIRSLLLDTSTLEAHLRGANQRIVIVAQTATTIIRQWEQFCSTLTELSEFRFQTRKLRESQADGGNTSTTPHASATREAESATALVSWTIEPVQTLTRIISSASLSAALLTRALIDDETALKAEESLSPGA